jgi:hypothetical protein
LTLLVQPTLKRNFSSFRRKLDPIGYEVQQDLFETALISAQGKYSFLELIR